MPAMSLTATAQYTGDGVQTTFTVPFEFVSRNDVRVKVNTDELTAGAGFTWVNDSTVNISPAPPNNSLVKIWRNTESVSRLVDFQDGSVLREADLDLALKQVFFLAQEIADGYLFPLESALVTLANNNGIVTTDSESSISELVEAILNDAAAGGIADRIADIDANTSAIAQINIDVAAAVADIGTLQVDLGTANSNISSLQTADATHTADITSLTTRVDGAESNITNLQTTTSTNSTDITSLTTRVDSAESNITTLQSTDATQATQISQLQTDVGGNTSSITTLNTTTSNNASSITTLQSDVSGNTASIGSLQSVTDGLEARYGVSLNVNGHITGFEQFNDGDSGTFNILADSFNIVDPANGLGTPTAVFAVTGGVVYAQNLKVTNAEIEDLSVNKLTTGNLGAQVTIDTGSITLDASGHIKGGQTGYDTGAGFFLGRDGGIHKFSIGDGGANRLTWDGTTLTVTGDIGQPNYAAGDTTLLTAPTERTSPAASTTWGVQKRFTIARAGIVRVKWEDRYTTWDTTPDNVIVNNSVRIKVNGSVVDTRTVTTGSFTARSADVTVPDMTNTVEIEIRTGFGTDLGADTYRTTKIRNAEIAVANTGTDTTDLD